MERSKYKKDEEKSSKKKKIKGRIIHEINKEVRGNYLERDIVK